MQIILKVHLDDSEERCLEFPVNPDSTCEDVLACVQESGEGPAILTQLANGHGMFKKSKREKYYSRDKSIQQLLFTIVWCCYNTVIYSYWIGVMFGDFMFVFAKAFNTLKGELFRCFAVASQNQFHLSCFKLHHECSEQIFESKCMKCNMQCYQKKPKIRMVYCQLYLKELE